MRDPGSILTTGYWSVLFSCSKASDVNIGIIANFIQFVKTCENRGIENWSSIIIIILIFFVINSRCRSSSWK